MDGDRRLRKRFDGEPKNHGFGFGAACFGEYSERFDSRLHSKCCASGSDERGGDGQLRPKCGAFVRRNDGRGRLREQLFGRSNLDGDG